MNVTAEATASLPVRLRPTAEQVASWYEHALRAKGADVQRLAPGQLSFSLSLSQSFFDVNLAVSLAPLSEGELEVAETSDGFEVEVRATTRTWVTYLPLGMFVAATPWLAFVHTPIRFLPAAIGLALLGFGWLRTRGALQNFLGRTNEEIAESFAALPPAPRAASGAGGVPSAHEPEG